MLKNDNQLFCYGTLQDPQVLAILLGRVPDMCKGTIFGWRAAPLKGLSYPGLVKDTSVDTHGTVLANLTLEELQILDTFEDVRYDISLVDIVSYEGDKYMAPAYIWSDIELVKDGLWTLKNWLHHKGQYLENVQRWKDTYNTISVTFSHQRLQNNH